MLSAPNAGSLKSVTKKMSNFPSDMWEDCSTLTYSYKLTPGLCLSEEYLNFLFPDFFRDNLSPFFFLSSAPPPQVPTPSINIDDTSFDPETNTRNVSLTLDITVSLLLNCIDFLDLTGKRSNRALPFTISRLMAP